MFASLFSPLPAPALLSAGRAFSPRVERHLDGRLLVIDAAGLGRVVGDAATIARELGRMAVGAEGSTSTVGSRTSDLAPVSIAVAPTRIAAILLAIGRPGKTVVAPGRTTAAVGALGLEVFEQLARIESAKKRPCALCVLCLISHRRARTLCGQPGGACTELPTLRRWGIATLGALAALPADGLAARLGQPGVALQRIARGLDLQPLVPMIDAPRFEASLDLEWPIEELQPLSFVLTRLLEPLSAALERADRGAAAIVTELTLVRLRAEPAATYVRRLELPAPMRDARVLRTLVLLDLESHPPPAAVDRLALRIEPTPARIVQFSLIEQAGPRPETTATLVARLTALMGDGRVGSPALVDSHAPGAFTMGAFQSEASGQRSEAREAGGVSGDPAISRSGDLQIARSPDHQIARFSVPALRRFRFPVPARVVLEHGRPVRVTTDRIGIKGGAVEECAGPWRSSGEWWRHEWNRDEYDVALSDAAAYRIFRDRNDERWYVEGILD
jgi:protein ImuB